MEEYRNAGLHEILYKARDIISQVGFTRHMHCDPITGAVDLEGALLLALGAKKLPVMVEVLDDYIPETAQAALDAALCLIESEVGDSTEWVDKRGTAAEAIRLLGRLGDEVAIA